MGPILALLVTAAFVLAYANGANENFKATATVYGSGTLGYDAARRLATFAQLAGSLASIALATGLLEAFSGKGLVPAEVVGDPRFLVAVATGGAATVLLATRVGLPISTTHALVGGLAGAGLALGPGQLSWAALGGGYFVPRSRPAPASVPWSGRIATIAEATKIPAMASTVREYPAPARRSLNAMNALSLKRRGSRQ